MFDNVAGLVYSGLATIKGKAMKYVLIILIFLSISSCDTDEFMNEACRHKNDGIHYTFAQIYMDSAYVGLNRFYKDKGHYPAIEGKYFFDSIKTYLGTLKASVFTDKDDFGVDSCLGVDNCFLAVGSNDSPIIYRYRGDHIFLLYWVGENGIDEIGTGDDIVYKKDR